MPKPCFLNCGNCVTVGNDSIDERPQTSRLSNKKAIKQMSEKTNAPMAEFWNGEGGSKWLSFEDRLEASLKVFGDKALACADVQAGQRVLDIGCGCGPTTLELARLVGKSGRATGLDISTRLTTKAENNARAAGVSNVEFECADAQTKNFGDESFDLVFSRFGVMFFDDPVRAFANLRSALAPGGRLLFAAWASREQNSWVAEPLQRVMKHIELPDPPAADAPGPFSLGNPQRVKTILDEAGYRDITIDAFSPPLIVGADIPEAVHFLMNMSPSGGAISAANPDQETLERIAADLARMLEVHQARDSVAMGATALIVSAQK